jgi:hypothetical protein
LLADAGYYSEDNVNACEEAKIEAYIPFRRESHYWGVKERIEPEGSHEAATEDESPSSFSETDRLLEEAIETTLRWHELSCLSGPKGK